MEDNEPRRKNNDQFKHSPKGVYVDCLAFDDNFANSVNINLVTMKIRSIWDSLCTDFLYITDPSGGPELIMMITDYGKT